MRFTEKTIENEKKHKNLRLPNSPNKRITYTSKPTSKKTYLKDKDLTLVHFLKEMVKLKRPIYIGQAVLDISKLRLYELFYGELATYVRNFRGKINILGGDADSFFLKN